MRIPHRSEETNKVVARVRPPELRGSTKTPGFARDREAVLPRVRRGRVAVAAGAVSMSAATEARIGRAVMIAG